jgi:hypothetical protein
MILKIEKFEWENDKIYFKESGKEVSVDKKSEYIAFQYSDQQTENLQLYHESND